MWNGLEKRLSRIEVRLKESKEGPRFCNCSVHTRFHNPDCLVAVLKGIPWTCPIHGFRNLGRFFRTPTWSILSTRDGIRNVGIDNQFCPCPPHPWRSHVLSGPHTHEEGDAAREAWDKLPRDPILDPQEAKRRLQERNRRIDAIFEEYVAACREWFEKSGRDLTNRPELAKLIWLRAREHDSQESRPSV